MTGIKLCGLSRPCDIEAANALLPEYIGFVFAEKSRRRVTFEQAAELKKLLDPGIKAVGVFVNERPETVAQLLNADIIDLAQLHGDEDGEYIKRLRALSPKPIIRAFRISGAEDLLYAAGSSADYVLLDSGAGTGTAFDWNIIRNIDRPYFLAGGLDPKNVGKAVRTLHPYAVDVSSGIETGGLKDRGKMAEFTAAVRKEDNNI